jgi:hypothetical protein
VNKALRPFMTVARRVVEQAIGEKMDGSPLDDPNAGLVITSKAANDNHLR